MRSVVGSRFLDPAVLAQLPDMELRARRLMQGVFVGYHKSPQFGYSVEFADHREYVHGDDLRTVDWKVWARRNKYYVKRFEMESQLKATILLDVSRSMDFGEGRFTKLVYGSMLAATLAYLIIHQNDMAGLVTFDREVREYIPPRGSRPHLRLLLHLLDSVAPGPETNVARVCHHLAETIRARGMIIVISDLLDDEEAVLHALRHFQYKKHDVMVFHLLDDSELTLPYDELANFVDLESGRRVAVDPATYRRTYRERVAGFCTRLKEGCQQTNIDYQRISPGQPLETVVTQFLTFRQRRSR